MPVTWSDEKLILLYCPGRGSNSRPSAHRGFKHGQGVPRPYSLGHDYVMYWCGVHWLLCGRFGLFNFVIQTNEDEDNSD